MILIEKYKKKTIYKYYLQNTIYKNAIRSILFETGINRYAIHGYFKQTTSITHSQ